MKHMIEELKEMIQKKDPKEPVEKVLAIFVQRYRHFDGDLPSLLQQVS